MITQLIAYHIIADLILALVTVYRLALSDYGRMGWLDTVVLVMFPVAVAVFCCT